MGKSAMIRARVEPDLKDEVESLFAKLGLTATEAINLFYRQVKLRKGLPFDVRIPNRTTRKAMRDTDQGKNLIHVQSVEDMFKKLKI
jgi:DNA-damage-inducible protein J